MRESLALKILWRMLFSFAFTVAVSQVVMLINIEIIIHATGNVQAAPLVPSYAAHFSNPYTALIVQILLCGLIGMSFGGCSFIFEVAKWSMVKQALIHFVLTSVVWIPVCMFCWGLGRYRNTMISVCISLCFTYAVTWITRILYYRKETREINRRLMDLLREEKITEYQEETGGI